MSDDDAPTPKKSPPDESVAKLRKLAEDNPDDSLLNDVAATVEEKNVRLINVSKGDVAEIQRELKRRADVKEGLKEEEKRLALAKRLKRWLEDPPSSTMSGNVSHDARKVRLPEVSEWFAHHAC